MMTSSIGTRVSRATLGRIAKTADRVFLAVALTAGSALVSGCTSVPMAGQQTAYTTVKAGYPTLPQGKGAGLPAKKVANTVYHGRAPHICTPSGFGRTSGCFARS